MIHRNCLAVLPFVTVFTLAAAAGSVFAQANFAESFQGVS